MTWQCNDSYVTKRKMFCSMPVKKKEHNNNKTKTKTEDNKEKGRFIYSRWNISSERDQRWACNERSRGSSMNYNIT